MDAGIWLVSFWFIWVESFRKSFLKNEGLMSIIPWKQPSPIAVVGLEPRVLITHFNTTLHVTWKYKPGIWQRCHNEGNGPTCHAAWTEQIVAPKSKILTCCFCCWPSPFLEAFHDDGRFFNDGRFFQEGKGCLEIRLCLFSACLWTMCSWKLPLGSFLPFITFSGHRVDFLDLGFA